MRTFCFVLGFGIFSGLVGCSTSPTQVIESTGSRILPDWTERQTFEAEGKTFFVGSAVLESGSSSACFIAADEKALSEAGRNLVNTFMDQATVVESADEPSVKRVISSLRTERTQIDGLVIVDRFTQLVRIESQGYTRMERRCWSLASAPTGKVVAAVQNLARKLRGEKGSAQDASLESIAASQRKGTLKE
jgi:hypothetical protein